MERIVVITGGTSGIGAETAKLFRNNGDKVITLARKNDNDDADFYKCDVGDAAQIEACFGDIAAKFGRIDVLVNNAGYGLNGVLELLPQNEIEKQFGVNVYGVINCTRYALPFMQKGAKIINVTSCMALFPMPYRSMYAATKSAVHAFSISQRMELTPLGIDLCIVCPGDVKTNFTKSKAVVLNTNERYGDAPQKAQEKLDSAEREAKRMPPRKVANEIFALSNKKKTKPITIVGAKYKALDFFARFVPKSWVIAAINKIAK